MTSERHFVQLVLCCAVELSTGRVQHENWNNSASSPTHPHGRSICAVTRGRLISTVAPPSPDLGVRRSRALVAIHSSSSVSMLTVFLPSDQLCLLRDSPWTSWSVSLPVRPSLYTCLSPVAITYCENSMPCPSFGPHQNYACHRETPPL